MKFEDKIRILLAYCLGIPALYFVLVKNDQSVLGKEVRRAFLLWLVLVLLFFGLRLVFNWFFGLGINLPVIILERTSLFLMVLYLLFSAFRAVYKNA